MSKKSNIKPHPFLRVLLYLRFFKKEIVLNFFFNMLSVVFNLCSYVMMVPVIELFFGVTTPPAVEPQLGFSQSEVTDWALWHLYALKESIGLWSTLLVFAGGYLSCNVLYNLCRYMGFFFISPLRSGIMQHMHNDMYRKITVLPISFFSHYRKGDIISRMSADMSDIRWCVEKTVETFFKETLSILLFASALIFISPRLFLLFIVTVPPAAFLIVQIGKSLNRNAVKGQVKMGEMMSVYKETLDNMEVVKAYGQEAYRQRTYETSNVDYTRRMMRVAYRNEAGGPLSEILGIVGLGVVLVIGGRAAVGGDIPPSVFMLFVILFAKLIAPVQALVRAYSGIQKGKASAARIFEILDADERIVEIPDAVIMHGFDKEIKYNDVSFAYENVSADSSSEDERASNRTVDVLSHVCLTIPKGMKVAIVGPSGAGKTTLVDLLPRFYDTTGGEVTVDGVPLRSMNINSLRSNIGVVSQNCILFNDSIANNITFGLKNVSFEQIREAARMANADDFIMQMPQGYDTPVGDRGSALSGGQRQRISIARAILRNPPIMILDEATSALDNASQQIVQDALDKMMQGRTSIVIAHRLSTIVNADMIVVMDHGRVVEQGTHAELMAKGGVYHGLVQMQTL